LLALPIVGIAAAGGWSEMIDNLGRQDPFLLTPMGAAGFSTEGIVAVAGLLGIGLACLGAPQLLARFMSARSCRSLVRARLPAVGCAILFDVGAICSGMAGRALCPEIRDHDSVPPVMSKWNLYPVFTAIFFIAAPAAMMQPLDSPLLMASSTLS